MPIVDVTEPVFADAPGVPLPPSGGAVAAGFGVLEPATVLEALYHDHSVDPHIVPDESSTSSTPSVLGMRTSPEHSPEPPAADTKRRRVELDDDEEVSQYLLSDNEEAPDSPLLEANAEGDDEAGDEALAVLDSNSPRVLEAKLRRMFANCVKVMSIINHPISVLDELSRIREADKNIARASEEDKEFVRVAARNFRHDLEAVMRDAMMETQELPALTARFLPGFVLDPLQRVHFESLRRFFNLRSAQAALCRRAQKNTAKYMLYYSSPASAGDFARVGGALLLAIGRDLSMAYRACARAAVVLYEWAAAIGITLRVDDDLGRMRDESSNPTWLPKTDNEVSYGRHMHDLRVIPEIPNPAPAMPGDLAFDFNYKESEMLHIAEDVAGVINDVFSVDFVISSYDDQSLSLFFGFLRIASEQDTMLHYVDSEKVLRVLEAARDAYPSAGLAIPTEPSRLAMVVHRIKRLSSDETQLLEDGDV